MWHTSTFLPITFFLPQHNLLFDVSSESTQCVLSLCFIALEPLTHVFYYFIILDSRIKTYFPLITPIPHCTQTLNCWNPWSKSWWSAKISIVMVCGNGGLLTLEMAHRARCGDVPMEMVSCGANKEMRWEMTLAVKFFWWLIGNNRNVQGTLKLGCFIWNVYGFK